MGVSSRSWERAAAAAVREAVASFADHCLMRRVSSTGIQAPTFTTEVVRLDLTLKPSGDIEHYRALVKVSFLSLADSSELPAVQAITD
jgi:flavin-binding protein dodecin